MNKVARKEALKKEAEKLGLAVVERLYVIDSLAEISRELDLPIDVVALALQEEGIFENYSWRPKEKFLKEGYFKIYTEYNEKLWEQLLITDDGKNLIVGTVKAHRFKLIELTCPETAYNDLIGFLVDSDLCLCNYPEPKMREECEEEGNSCRDCAQTWLKPLLAGNKTVDYQYIKKFYS